MTVHPGPGRGARRPPPALAVVGPTATGKTALAVRLALRLGRAELVNADSRQVLRGLHVGTNTPGPGDLDGVPCHLLGIAEPGRPFSVADWLAAAQSCLAALELRGARPIVVGGTGLYVRALLDGLELDGAPPDPARRAVLNARAASPEGLAELAGELRRRDPEGARESTCATPGGWSGPWRSSRRAAASRAGAGVAPPVRASGSAWTRRPSCTVEWIAERARAMVAGGLLDETGTALARGVRPEALDGCGIGYREALAVLDGRLSAAEAVAEIVRRTTRYAKAQRTWFRADRSVVWLGREREDDLDELVTRAVALAEER
jgi:tRNA dimethylallyltransferase